MKRLKYLLVIPDGVGLRNFVCSQFIDLLLESGDVCVWHALPPAGLTEFQRRWGHRVRWEHLPPIRDGLVERFLRQAKVFAQLYWQMKQGPDVQLKRRRRPVRWRARLMEYSAKGMGRLNSGARRIALLDRFHQKAAARSPHTRLFERFVEGLGPDVVFCTHQQAIFAVPAMLAARKLGIPSATFIYSWDNLPKGRMAVYADYFFVWSEFMKNELLSYYPDVTPERIQILGTPQFEPYADKSLIESRESFLANLKLDPNRPVVCFSGDDVLASPYDPEYLKDLAEALETIPLPSRPQILFRRCPVDRSPRYDDVLRKYPSIAVSDPPWKVYGDGGWWAQIIPTQEDESLLVNVVVHCDLVVNLGSTMAMDFAVYDKPAIYVAYNPKSANSGWNVHDCYKLPHIRSVLELQPVHWARSREELGSMVMHALRNPGEKSSARRAWFHRHVLQPIGGASDRFARALYDLAAAR